MEKNNEDKRISAEDYNFVKFNMEGSRYNPFISVGKSNRLGISQSFIDINSIGDKNSADLFFDKDKQAIGIVFKEGKSGKLVLNLLVRQGGYINAKGFFGLNRIDPNKYSGRYHNIKKVPSPDGVIFVFELSEKNKTP